jgi:hypothetical protein
MLTTDLDRVSGTRDASIWQRSALFNRNPPEPTFRAQAPTCSRARPEGPMRATLVTGYFGSLVKRLPPDRNGSRDEELPSSAYHLTRKPAFPLKR